MTPKKHAEYIVNKFLNMPICESVWSAKYAAYFCLEEIRMTSERITKHLPPDLILKEKEYYDDVEKEIDKL